MRASVWGRSPALPSAGSVSPKSAGGALHCMYSHLLHLLVHGKSAAAVGPISRHLQKGGRIRSVSPAQPLRLCPAATGGEILADPECGAPDDDLLGIDIGLACWHFVCAHLRAWVGVPWGCTGDELVVLAQRYLPDLVCEVLRGVRRHMERIFEGRFCRPPRVSQPGNSVLHHDLVSNKLRNVLNLVILLSSDNWFSRILRGISQGSRYQCWSEMSLFDTIRVFIMRIFGMQKGIGYGYLMVFSFSILFGSIYHARTFKPRQNCPNINMV